MDVLGRLGLAAQIEELGAIQADAGGAPLGAVRHFVGKLDVAVKC